MKTKNGNVSILISLVALVGIITIVLMILFYKDGNSRDKLGVKTFTSTQQFNQCVVCSNNVDCGSGNICVTQPDLASQNNWEIIPDPFSNSLDPQYTNLLTNYGGVTAWDTFTTGEFKTKRIVRNGKVYKKELGRNSTNVYENQEKFLCGVNCGAGFNIYDVSLFQRGNNITYYLVRNNNIYFKTFPASVYSDNITEILNKSDGWKNYNSEYPNVRSIGGLDSIFTGFNVSRDHMGNISIYLVRQNLKSNTSKVFHQLQNNGTNSKWKPVFISNNIASNPDIFIKDSATPTKVFSIDNTYDPLTKTYIFTIVAKINSGKRTFSKVTHLNSTTNYCKTLSSFTNSCGNSTQLKCQVDGKVLTPSYKQKVGMATNQPLIHNEDDARKVALVLNDLGVDYARRGINWHSIEATPGIFNWNYGVINGLGLLETTAPLLKEQNIELLATVTGVPVWASMNGSASNFSAYPPKDINQWKNFISKVVTKYGYGNNGAQLIRNWEIWNEPNFHLFLVQDGGYDAKVKYNEMLVAAYETIHQVDPQARVWGPSVLFNKEFNDSAAKYDKDFASYIIKNGKFDVYSIHIYANVADAQEYIRWVRNQLDINNKQFIPIAVTEINLEYGNGYPYCRDGADAYQNEIIKQVYTCAYNAGAEYVFWFGLKDYYDPNECRNTATSQINKHGVVDKDYMQKPAYEVLKNLTSQLK